MSIKKGEKDMKIQNLIKVASFIEILARVSKNERVVMNDIDRNLHNRKYTNMCPDGIDLFEKTDDLGMGYERYSIIAHDRNGGLTYDFIDYILVLMRDGDIGPFGMSILSLWQIYFNMSSDMAESEMEWIGFQLSTDFDRHAEKIYSMLTIQ